jgi:hypothetical protein
MTEDYVKAVADNRRFGVRLFDIADTFKVGDMMDELMEYCNVLLGRTPPPVDYGAWTLMELAEAYHARASEMEMVIFHAEQQGKVTKGSTAYRFRTSQLRTFLEMTRRMMDMGSRRITAVQMLMDENK